MVRIGSRLRRSRALARDTARVLHDAGPKNVDELAGTASRSGLYRCGSSPRSESSAEPSRTPTAEPAEKACHPGRAE